MEEGIRLDRREFTLQAMLAALAGVTITVSGCGGGGGNDGNPSGPSGGPTDRVGVISGNHGHSATITNAQLLDGAALQLDIRGSADHPHTVALTADEVREIAAGREVAKTSTNAQGHEHTVTFRQGAPASGDPRY